MKECLHSAESSSIPGIIVGEPTNPHHAGSLSFAFSILAFSGKTLHEWSKIFIEYALRVVRSDSLGPRPNIPDFAAILVFPRYSGLNFNHRFYH